MLKVLIPLSLLVGYGSAAQCAAYKQCTVYSFGTYCSGDHVPVDVCWVESSDGTTHIAKQWVCDEANDQVQLKTYTTTDCSGTATDSGTAKACNTADDECVCGASVAVCDYVRSQTNLKCADSTEFQDGEITVIGCYENKDGSSTKYYCYDQAEVCGVFGCGSTIGHVGDDDYTDKMCSVEPTEPPSAPTTDRPTSSPTTPIPTTSPVTTTTPPPTPSCDVWTTSMSKCTVAYSAANTLFPSLFALFIPFVFMLGY